MGKKLIIWDFDGVIANTEDYWLKNRQKLLRTKMNLNWSWEEINEHLRGISEKTKRERLNALNIVTDDSFWDEAVQMDQKTIKEETFALAPGIKDIFRLPVKQCIATGGIKTKTAEKIENVGIRAFFPDKYVFTADMVEHGKPAPDLFLLAAKKVGIPVSESIVIEDSYAGINAALAAGCLPICYLGFYGKEHSKFVEQLYKMKLPYYCQNMADVKNVIESLL